MSAPPAWRLERGARPDAAGVAFAVWAPARSSVEVKLVGPEGRRVPLARDSEGVWSGAAAGARPGDDYLYVLDGDTERPDPVSRWQPQGVHGPSRVVAPEDFAWTDASWRGLPLRDYVVYELHPGTFTPEGTFDAILPRLDELRELGVTAVELMPVAQFPGERNWGYDGAHPYAVQHSYGGPEGLKRLVDACHQRGLAVVLDVVYNHLGPEGNYLAQYGPYFTRRYGTPWGEALNFDGPDSDQVRRYFIDNALYWVSEYHVDALRLDAIHGIFDFSALHLLEELSAAVHAVGRRLGREVVVIAESDLNDVRVINPVEIGGYGVDAQWSDDFHHALHAVLTGTRRGYFADFGRVADLARALTAGFVYDGRYSAFRRRRHGSSAATRPGEQLVICVQNHDQIANGYQGQRLPELVEPARERLAAALLLCAPDVPLIFMGQEYGETAPFFYFTSHGDPGLADAVREGRREEFASFGFPAAAFADPQEQGTFTRSRLRWERREQPPHAGILRCYRDLLRVRGRRRALGNHRRDLARVDHGEHPRWLSMRRDDPGGDRAMLVCNLEAEPQRVPAPADESLRLGCWTGAPEYGGSPGTPPPPEELSAETAAIQLGAWEAALYLSE